MEEFTFLQIAYDHLSIRNYLLLQPNLSKKTLTIKNSSKVSLAAMNNIYTSLKELNEAQDILI